MDEQRHPADIICYFIDKDNDKFQFTMSFSTDLTPGYEDQELTEYCSDALKAVGFTNMIIKAFRYTYI